MAFVLFYFVSGSLPWQGASKEEIEMEINRKVTSASEADTPILLSKCRFLEQLEFPRTRNEIKKVFFFEFGELVRTVFEMESGSEPNYNELERRCLRLLLLSGARKGDCFEWCRQDCPQRQREELWDIFSSAS